MNTCGRFAFCCRLAGLFAWLAVSVAYSQSVAPDAAMLAKYDTNKNGRLDPDEIAAMEAAQKSTPQVAPSNRPSGDETVVLSPFEVTSEGRGYYASSTMSGTRLN